MSRVAWSQEGLLSRGTAYSEVEFESCRVVAGRLAERGTADSEVEFELCCMVAGGPAERADGLLGGGV